jgi:RNA polymerase sigma factor (TIGR02999 family)
VAADARFRDHYGELRRMARSRLRHHETFTLLDTTALVHESFLRLSRAGGVRSTDEPAFLAYAGRVMRSVIVDAARSRLTIRRGEGIKASELDEDAAEQVSDAPAQIIIDLHDALLSLQSTEPRLAQVIELQYFGGMADAEVAVALGMSDRTVRRDADRARMMLRALLA